MSRDISRITNGIFHGYVTEYLTEYLNGIFYGYLTEYLTECLNGISSSYGLFSLRNLYVCTYSTGFLYDRDLILYCTDAVVVE